MLRVKKGVSFHGASFTVARHFNTQQCGWLYTLGHGKETSHVPTYGLLFRCVLEWHDLCNIGGPLRYTYIGVLYVGKDGYRRKTILKIQLRLDHVLKSC